MAAHMSMMHALVGLDDDPPVDIQSPKKRKLALVKCERCRVDKVKVSDSESPVPALRLPKQPLRTFF
jgi:hypothetical protein